MQAIDVLKTDNKNEAQKLNFLTLNRKHTYRKKYTSLIGYCEYQYYIKYFMYILIHYYFCMIMSVELSSKYMIL